MADILVSRNLLRRRPKPRTLRKRKKRRRLLILRRLLRRVSVPYTHCFEGRLQR
jgi:hypothetical protein